MVTKTSDVKIALEYKIVNEDVLVRACINDNLTGWAMVLKLGEVDREGNIITKKGIAEWMKEKGIKDGRKL